MQGHDKKSRKVTCHRCGSRRSFGAVAGSEDGREGNDAKQNQAPGFRHSLSCEVFPLICSETFIDLRARLSTQELIFQPFFLSDAPGWLASAPRLERETKRVMIETASPPAGESQSPFLVAVTRPMPTQSRFSGVFGSICPVFMLGLSSCQNN